MPINLLARSLVHSRVALDRQLRQAVEAIVVGTPPLLNRIVTRTHTPSHKVQSLSQVVLESPGSRVLYCKNIIYQASPTPSLNSPLPITSSTVSTAANNKQCCLEALAFAFPSRPNQPRLPKHVRSR
jgi:hypothetical protein